jgi:hypothetical protein
MNINHYFDKEKNKLNHKQNSEFAHNLVIEAINLILSGVLSVVNPTITPAPQPNLSLLNLTRNSQFSTSPFFIISVISKPKKRLSTFFCLFPIPPDNIRLIGCAIGKNPL